MGFPVWFCDSKVIVVVSCTFSYETSAISVRLGKVLPQSIVKNFDRSRHTEWTYLCIEGEYVFGSKSKLE